MRLADVETWLHRLDVSAGTWTNYARVIGSVFTLAVKRGFLPASPLTGLDRPKINRKAPGILTPSQISALLAAAAPELRPLLILQAFCGIRRAESCRVQWRHIHLEANPPYLKIPNAVTKTGSRRSHEIQPCPVAWLRPLAGLPAASLALTDAVYDDRLQKAASAAGIVWDANLLRHSFGTYRLAVTKNAALVAEEMGNSPDMVRKRYANVTSPEQAAAWWKVLPAPPPAAPIPFRKVRAAS